MLNQQEPSLSLHAQGAFRCLDLSTSHFEVELMSFFCLKRLQWKTKEHVSATFLTTPKSLGKISQFQAWETGMKKDLFLNNRNYMKSNPLHAVSQAFADTNDPGNAHKLAPGLSASWSSHPPPQSHKGWEEMRKVTEIYTGVPLRHSISFGWDIENQSSAFHSLEILRCFYRWRFLNKLLYRFSTRNLGRALKGWFGSMSLEKLQ